MAIANFSIATSEKYKDEEKTEWHNIVCFNKLAEICGEYLHKGKPVYIEGKIQTRSWEDKEGIKRYTTEIVADKMVMLGGMLAGTDEGGGDVIDVNGRKMVEFYGMSSITAQKKHGGVKNYRASEGRTTLIPYKGSMDTVISEILGGIRSTCTYVNARTIDELKYNVEFERVNAILNTTFDQFTVGK